LLAADNSWASRCATVEALTAQSFPSVSVVVVTFNNLALTQDCLESLRRNTRWPRREIIVVDNASNDGTVEYLHTFAEGRPEVRIIANAKNRGFAAANNQGLAVATGDILVLMNNDVVAPAGWTGGLARALADPGVGLTGPVTNMIGNEARIGVAYTALNGLEAFASAQMRSHEGERFDIAVLAMFCVALRREVFSLVGELDEQFGIGMFEDDDYSNRVRQYGYRVVCCEDSYVHHVGGASFRALDSAAYQALWDANLAYFEGKWGAWKPHVLRPALRAATP
jgi:GT2 family glycosyltransferase